jgi:hypothetical protein
MTTLNTLDVIRITALTAALFNVVLTILVLGRDYRSTLHRVYLLWGAGITFWNFGVYNLSRDIGPEEALFWAKFCQLGVIFIPVSLFHLAMIISKTHIPRIILALYGITVCLAVSLFLDRFIVGVRRIDVGYFSVPGPGFHVFTAFYIAIITSFMLILYRKQKVAPPTQRRRMRALLGDFVGFRQQRHDAHLGPHVLPLDTHQVLSPGQFGRDLLRGDDQLQRPAGPTVGHPRHPQPPSRAIGALVVYDAGGFPAALAGLPTGAREVYRLFFWGGHSSAAGQRAVGGIFLSPILWTWQR